MSLLESVPYPLITAFVFLFGAVIGSFLNVCIARLPLRLSIVSPRSRCLSCQVPLAWYDNLPVLSYLILRGRCRACHAAFSVRYVVVELMTAAFAVAVLDRFGVGGDGLVYFSFGAALIVIAFVDLDHQIIPDVLSIPGMAAGVLFAMASPTLSVTNSLLGLTVGAGSLLAVAVGYRAATGREGMGGGDVKLLGMIGAFLGWHSILFTLLFASFAGSAVGVYTMIRQRADAKLAIPFGPFLAFGALTYLFVGTDLVRWYLDLI